MKVRVLYIAQTYSYYLCQYHRFEIHAWSTINGVHDQNKGSTYNQYVWGELNKIILQRYDINYYNLLRILTLKRFLHLL